MYFSAIDATLVGEQVGLTEAEVSVITLITGGDIEQRHVRTSDIVSSLGLSRQYASRLLGQLEEKHLLLPTGAGPQAGYRLNEPALLDAYLETDVLLRSDKPFQMSRISDYEPGITHFMPQEVSEQLAAWSDTALKAGDTLNETVSRRYLIDFAWASSRLEGNTYSLIDTRELVERGIEAQDRTNAETQMIRNHIAAIEFIIEHARTMDYRPSDVRSIHALLSRDLLGNPDDEGRIRQSPVAINRSVYRPAVFPQVLEEGLGLICDKARQIENPYERSIFLLVQLSYLQPFIDVNKRTARLFSNVPLLQAGICPLSFFGVNEAAYIGGLMGYYETGNPSLAARAYRSGYEASVERFRSYRSQLAENLDQQDRAQRAAAKALVRQFVTAVVTGRKTPDDSAAFLREGLSLENDAVERDAVLIQAKRLLRDIDKVSAIKLGITPPSFRVYQAICDRFDALAAGRPEPESDVSLPDMDQEDSARHDSDMKLD